MDTHLRPPAVAGSFYPAQPARLLAAVRGYIDAAGSPLAGLDDPVARAPRMLVGPHAGFVYSGPVAGTGYAGLGPHASNYRRVVLIGPSHRVWFRGVAVPSHTAFATPLGAVPVCVESVRGLVDAGLAIVDDEPHRAEHGLEVHLPFLQVVLGSFQLVPLVVGDAAVSEVASCLRPWISDPATLVVVSTDLSHFLSHAAARERDAATAAAIERLDGGALGPEDACGWLPLAAALGLARETGLRVERLDLRDSSDTAGQPDRVVGYGAWVLV